MAKLRKWCAYRTIERPYTRFSKYRKKAFVKARPGKKVIKFDMGDLSGGSYQFPITLKLVSKEVGLARSNAIEAARLVALRRVEKPLGRLGFYFKVLMYPHHSIRENPLAAGAGADRLSTGMKHSFGKIIGTAARIEPDKVLLEISLPLEHEALAREALKAASKKLPLRTRIEMVRNVVVELTEEELLQQHLSQAKFDLQDANAALTAANRALEKAESAEDKKKAESDVINAKAKVESTQKIINVEKEHLSDFQEEHSDDVEEE